MFTTRLLPVAAAALVALSVGHGAAQPLKPPATTDSFPVPPESEAMKAKQKHAHAILDALTAGDADALRRNAEVMSLIADMRVFVAAYNTDHYKFEAVTFKRAADGMLKAAKEKNMDAASLAYFDMTRTCVKCHAHFRGVKK